MRSLRSPSLQGGEYVTVLPYDRALSKCFFHVVMRRVPHDTPNRVLHPTLCGSDGMVYTDSAVLPSRFCTLPELLGPSGLPECRWGQPLTTGAIRLRQPMQPPASCWMVYWSRLESYWCQILCSLSFLLTIAFPPAHNET